MEHVEDGSPPWTRTTTTRLTGGHAALTSAGNGSSARYRAAVSRLSGGCSAIELRRKGKMVAVSGIAPDSARLQRAANLSQLHSRGSPVRNRTAVCRLQGGGSAIELRGNEGWSRAPVPPRVFAALGPASRALRAAYGRLSRGAIAARFLVPSEADCCLPRARIIESLEMDGGGRDRTGAWAAYEAAAFPLGYPAVGKWWVVPVTLRRRPIGRLFYRQLTVFT